MRILRVLILVGFVAACSGDDAGSTAATTGAEDVLEAPDNGNDGSGASDTVETDSDVAASPDSEEPGDIHAGEEETANSGGGDDGVDRDVSQPEPEVNESDTEQFFDDDGPPPVDTDAPMDIEIPEDTAPSVDTESAADVEAPIEDVGPPSSQPLLRLTKLAIENPKLCYALPGGSNCLDVSGVVDSMLTSSFNAPVDPVDLLVQFDAILPAPNALMTLGGGSCERDDQGTIINCSFTNNAQSPAAEFKATELKNEGQCWAEPLVEAPCFVTPAVDTALNLAGVIVGMKEAVATGTFSGGNPKMEILNGHMEGFLPKSVAQTMQFELPNGIITLDQLLTQAPLVKKGNLMGWVLQLSYEAAQQVEK